MKNNLTKAEEEQGHSLISMRLCSSLISMRLEEVTAALSEAEAEFMEEPILTSWEAHGRAESARHIAVVRLQQYKDTLHCMASKYNTIDLTPEGFKTIVEKES